MVNNGYDGNGKENSSKYDSSLVIEILRNPDFARAIERGVDDIVNGRFVTITDEDLGKL